MSISKATSKAGLVAPEESNRIAKRLKMMEALLEAQHIEQRNNANDSWISSAKMSERLAKRG